MEKLGLERNEAQIFCYLNQAQQPLAVLNLSRELGLGRTAVYNAIDKLLEKNLVERNISSLGTKYLATSEENLERWWEKKTEEMLAQKPALMDLMSRLQGFQMPSSYESKVVYFSGQSGMEQLTYNSTKAVDDLYIYELKTDMSVFVEQETAERMREMLVKNKITTHQLTNFEKIEPYTEVADMVEKFWDIRYISTEILKIEFEMVIYNDVCALYAYEGKDVFGLEVHNENLARMQKQIFKAMQKLAVPMRKIGFTGEVTI